MSVMSWFGFGQAARAVASRQPAPPKNPPPSQPGSGGPRQPDVPDGEAPPDGHYTDIPIAGLGPWSVPRIQQALSSHQLGNFSQSGLLVDAMIGDDRVQSTMNGRAKGITARHLHTVRARRDKGGKARRAVERVWRKVFSDEFLDQFVVNFVMLGFCLCEVNWTSEEDPELGTIWVPYLKVWHASYVWYDISQRRYVAITQEGNVYIEQDDPHWFLFTPFGEYRGWLRGAVRSCSSPWIIRQYARRDWARYSEKHGLPIVLVDAPAQSSAIDKMRMFANVRNMGAQSTILLPQQAIGQDNSGAKWDIRLLEAKDEAWECFPGLIKDCNMAIQLAIRGTNLISEVEGGSYAAAQVHQDEDTAYGDADCRKLCAAATKLMRLFCQYNLGSADVCPFMRLEAPDKQDKTMLAQSQLNAMTIVDKAIERGIPIDIAAYFERYDIPLLGIEEGETFELDTEPADDPEPDNDDESVRGELLELFAGHESEETMATLRAILEAA
jgi:phage gp29-like protein